MELVGRPWDGDGNHPKDRLEVGHGEEQSWLVHRIQQKLSVTTAVD